MAKLLNFGKTIQFFIKYYITATIWIKGDKMTRKVEATINKDTPIHEAYRLIAGEEAVWHDVSDLSFEAIIKKIDQLEEEKQLEMIANLRVFKEIISNNVLISEEKKKAFLMELTAYLAGFDLNNRLFLDRVRNFR